MAAGVVERPAEFRAVSDLLQSAGMHLSGLVIDGEAGIGKTTVWLAGLTEAGERGFRVLSARAGQAETVLTFAALADLLGGVDPDVLAELPDVQRIAVDRVLLRTTAEGPATGESVVAAAFAAVVDRLSADAPILLAIDDVQWLDPSSQAVLAAAARRFTGRVGLLITERTEHEGAGAADWLQLADPDAMARVHVGPLSLGGLHALVSSRLGRSFPRPTMVRIAEISAGNPFYALELARAVDAGGSASVLPATLAELMRMRIGRLDREVQDLLLAAACASNPTVDLLAQVTGTPVDVAHELLEEPRTKGIIALDGDVVRFSHPLLARSVYTDATPRERRAMHRSLSETVKMPELRARHMALAASSADPTTLSALDVASNVASSRGAPAAAAELVELAIRLGGDTPERRIRAADHLIHAGDLPRATALLHGVIDTVPHGVSRALALNLLAGIEIHLNSFAEAVEMLKEALANAADQLDVRVRTMLLLSFAEINAGEFVHAMQHSERAVILAEGIDDPDLTSQVLAIRAMVTSMCGNGFDETALRRANALENPHGNTSITLRASAIYGVLLSWAGRLDEAVEQMSIVRRRCMHRGAETDLVSVAYYTTLMEVWRGRYTAAAALADETVERAQQLGGDPLQVVGTTMRAVVSAHTGRETETRTTATSAIELAERCGAPRLADWASISLGFLEVSLGNHAAAITALTPLIARFHNMPGTEIVTAGYVPDAVEALVSLGRHTDAEPMINAIEVNGRWLDRPWMLAIGARCRSMWLAAQGDIAGALGVAETALRHHERLPMPFERARTLLLVGQLQRRQRKKESARTALNEALATFEQLGAQLWANRARAELTRSSGAPAQALGLTASEQRVAELAATGMTTRDVAAALFISPKTVESNLARVYRKLGIKSRAELGRLMGDG
ncbi:LuxR family transcriptional regulator [Mycolicibacterium moriokaense]|uniref:Transcriptional regulator n=1 Tax=Mycolicibacterium moriokaense TaxID=39691 RepID=A0AAD1HHY5_9MYCO|nr:LuxR family transcriptional regulator [Mycolicibacterium moriokaense]MCV7042897.1 AAA family ATPase [Mycolicibacterium moriokaense]ORB15693.1 LuxR family transcriptional regulator [Mycolicibacterium moriokaense]BBX04551.1 transcriptional regulator [Mycolicibacterium moriokaense]